MSSRVNIAHDYANQAGGAERVAASLARHYGQRIWVSVFEPRRTSNLFDGLRVDTSWVNRVRALRNSRALLSPLLPLIISLSRVRGTGVLVASSSGWAHGLRWPGIKVVYCHNPGRWLYQIDDYFMTWPPPARAMLRTLMSPMRRLDRRWARTADHYVANSTSVAQRIREVYGIEATVIHPPVLVERSAPTTERVDGLFLTVARSRGYKGTASIVEAFAGAPDLRLVIVGSYEGDVPANVEKAGRVSDEELSQLYRSASGLIAIGREDFGLTPIEAHAHGCPVLALRAGGYLDTVIDGLNGRLIDEGTPQLLVAALRDWQTSTWNQDDIEQTAERFSEENFLRKMDALIESVTAKHVR